MSSCTTSSWPIERTWHYIYEAINGPPHSFLLFPDHLHYQILLRKQFSVCNSELLCKIVINCSRVEAMKQTNDSSRAHSSHPVIASHVMKLDGSLLCLGVIGFCVDWYRRVCWNPSRSGNCLVRIVLAALMCLSLSWSPSWRAFQSASSWIDPVDVVPSAEAQPM